MARRPAKRRRRSVGPAAVVLATLALIAWLAPLIANDRPILARAGDQWIAPALSELPILGRLFRARADGAAPGQPGGPPITALLSPPVPYSYRGIYLDEALAPPGRRHLLGTDALGRDLLARMIHGTRPSLLVGFTATGLALLLGGIFGTLAGLRGGYVDLGILRIVEVMTCFPPFILALAIVTAAGRGGLLPIIAAIAVSRATSMTRYVRGEVLRRRGEELWTAARATGASLPHLTRVHLLPLLARPLAVLISFSVSHAILLESSLSFLGLGVEPPNPSWGGMLAESRATLDAAWWPVVVPAVALITILSALSLAGERAAGGGDATDVEPA